MAVGIREVVVPGLSWVLGDGRQIRFWEDRWLGKKRLIEDGDGLVLPAADGILARDMWRDGIGRDMAMITPYVSESTRLELLSVVLDNVTGARDRISWSESADGEFSVKSAYALLSRNETPRPDLRAFYERIWKVVAPERVRLFLWLVGNQALMTNVERQRRHMSNTDLCQVCKAGSEITIHILRDCPAMRGLWERIVPYRRRNTFFGQTLLEWMFSNLGDDGKSFDSTWATTFAMGVWWSWKWRCDNVFGNNGRCRDRTKFIKDKAKEVTLANLKSHENDQHVPRVEAMVSWVAPSDGWMKLNTNGASRGNPGLATAGGVLRDGYGD